MMLMSKAIDIAMSQYGVMEIRGKADNPEVLKYFDALGFDGAQLKDETAWCAAFVNYCLKMAGLECSGKLDARSLLDVGVPVSAPQFGDVVVLWRASKDSWKGHVGFFVNQDAHYVYLMGGNQGNMACVAAYDIGRVLGYRRM